MPPPTIATSTGRLADRRRGHGGRCGCHHGPTAYRGRRWRWSGARARCAARWSSSPGGCSRSGSTSGTSGNLSARLGQRVLVTPSGVPYADLTEDAIVALDLDGRAAGPGLKPSRRCADPLRGLPRPTRTLGGFVHTHSPHAVAFAIVGEPIPPLQIEAAGYLGGAVRVMDYLPPADAQRARSACPRPSARTARSSCRTTGCTPWASRSTRRSRRPRSWRTARGSRGWRARWARHGQVPRCGDRPAPRVHPSSLRPALRLRDDRRCRAGRAPPAVAPDAPGARVHRRAVDRRGAWTSSPTSPAGRGAAATPAVAVPRHPERGVILRDSQESACRRRGRCARRRRPWRSSCPPPATRWPTHTTTGGWPSAILVAAGLLDIGAGHQLGAGRRARRGGRGPGAAGRIAMSGRSWRWAARARPPAGRRPPGRGAAATRRDGLRGALARR